MFNQFSNFIQERDYFGAGLILSSIGKMLSPPSKRQPEGFFDSQVRVIPMPDCMHIFVLVGNKPDFWSLPGDQISATSGTGARLLSKRMVMSELYSGDCDTPIQLHFLYAYEDQPATMEA